MEDAAQIRGIAIDPTRSRLLRGEDTRLRVSAMCRGSDDVAVSLNTAFMSDGVAIRVADGAASSKPIHLALYLHGATAAHDIPRSLVDRRRRARSVDVDREPSSDRTASTIRSIARSSLSIGDKAHVDHIKISRDGDAALHVSTLERQRRRAAQIITISPSPTGGAVVRNQTFVRFAGEGTKPRIRGANLLKGRQHADNTLVIDHAAGRCTSRERFKSVLDGESRGIFQGKIIVEHARAEDRRQDGDARAAAVGRGRSRQQARTRNLRRRRAMRPRRHRRRARRGP